MEKRYQVFVSSTYADLQKERGKVIQALMEMDCIPSGMELFPAVDEAQWEFIKKVINDCDYYLLIIGGRYGSLTTEGISYTEKEFDYAASKGIKVIAFLHGSPGDIPVKKSEIDPALRKKLEQFREKASDGRLVKYWQTAEELPGLVALSLSKTIKAYPAVGWIRADKATNADLLGEINDLRKENETLRTAVDKISGPTPPVADIAPLEDSYSVWGSYISNYGGASQKWEVKTTWRHIFALLSPHLLQFPNDYAVQGVLANTLFPQSKASGRSPSLNDQVFQTIKIQLMAHSLVMISYTKSTKGEMGLFWGLTEHGKSLMLQFRTIRKK